MSDEPQPQPQFPSNADEKARLECEKLKAEIKSIGKPLFRTPGFYSAFAPVALAVLGLVFTWSTGWFDVQRTRVSNEKTLLEAQTERLKTERVTLEAQAKEQQARVARAEEEISKLKERERGLTNQLVRLERERAELLSAKNFLDTETKRLAGSDAKASQFLEQLKSLQSAREQLSTDVLALQRTNATLQATVTQQINFIVKAQGIVQESLRLATSDRQTQSKFANYIDRALDFQVDAFIYLPWWRPDTGLDKTPEDYRREIQRQNPRSP